MMKRCCVFIIFALVELNYYHEATAKSFGEWLIEKEEESREVIMNGDTITMNIDVTAAQQFPERDDLNIRVYTVPNNVTLCSAKLFEFADDGNFPCTFDETDSKFRLFSNSIELEVYSTVSGKQYSSQVISDVHYMDNVILDGHYEDFLVPSTQNKQIAKTSLISAIEILFAYLVIDDPSVFFEFIQTVVKIPFEVCTFIINCFQSTIHTM